MKELFKIYSGVFIALFLGFGFYSLDFLHTKSAEAHSIGGSGISGGGSAKTGPCATGYTRTAPNFCRAHPNSNGSSWADATACTSRTVNATNPLPSTAKMVLIEVLALNISNNAVANRRNIIRFYTDSSCTTIWEDTDITLREWVAVAAGTPLDQIPFYLWVPLTGTNTIHTTQLNAGGNGNVDIQAMAAIAYME